MHVQHMKISLFLFTAQPQRIVGLYYTIYSIHTHHFNTDINIRKILLLLLLLLHSELKTLTVRTYVATRNHDK